MLFSLTLNHKSCSRGFGDLPQNFFGFRGVYLIERIEKLVVFFGGFIKRSQACPVAVSTGLGHQLIEVVSYAVALLRMMKWLQWRMS